MFVMIAVIGSSIGIISFNESMASETTLEFDNQLVFVYNFDGKLTQINNAEPQTLNDLLATLPQA